MLGEIRRKREAFERDCEEEALRSAERGPAITPLNEPPDTRASGESDDDQSRVC